MHSSNVGMVPSPPSEYLPAYQTPTSEAILYVCVDDDDLSPSGSPTMTKTFVQLESSEIGLEKNHGKCDCFSCQAAPQVEPARHSSTIANNYQRMEANAFNFCTHMAEPQGDFRMEAVELEDDVDVIFIKRAGQGEGFSGEDAPNMAFYDPTPKSAVRAKSESIHKYSSGKPERRYESPQQIEFATINTIDDNMEAESTCQPLPAEKPKMMRFPQQKSKEVIRSSLVAERKNSHQARLPSEALQRRSDPSKVLSHCITHEKSTSREMPEMFDSPYPEMIVPEATGPAHEEFTHEKSIRPSSPFNTNIVVAQPLKMETVSPIASLRSSQAEACENEDRTGVVTMSRCFIQTPNIMKVEVADEITEVGSPPHTAVVCVQELPNVLTSTAETICLAHSSTLVTVQEAGEIDWDNVKFEYIMAEDPVVVLIETATSEEAVQQMRPSQRLVQQVRDKQLLAKQSTYNEIESLKEELVESLHQHANLDPTLPAVGHVSSPTCQSPLQEAQQSYCETLASIFCMKYQVADKTDIDTMEETCGLVTRVTESAVQIAQLSHGSHAVNAVTTSFKPTQEDNSTPDVTEIAMKQSPPEESNVKDSDTVVGAALASPVAPAEEESNTMHSNRSSKNDFQVEPQEAARPSLFPPGEPAEDESKSEQPTKSEFEDEPQEAAGTSHVPPQDPAEEESNTIYSDHPSKNDDIKDQHHWPGKSPSTKFKSRKRSTVRFSMLDNTLKTELQDSVCNVSGPSVENTSTKVSIHSVQEVQLCSPPITLELEDIPSAEVMANFDYIEMKDLSVHFSFMRDLTEDGGVPPSLSESSSRPTSEKGFTAAEIDEASSTDLCLDKALRNNVSADEGSSATSRIYSPFDTLL